ncbi:Phospholipid hydroperoxide glutathione peroxidase, mitochondrial [Lonchura striata]|uniref:Glutathione peroxidase n=1 Tax=Lonchura striata TaxID=40157 RepID=A0A218UAW9_9PASE|nr:Phospholipid hydroperoxide glutathione peroxidase, mitochondrial [Lonchura striata domestica]
MGWASAVRGVLCCARAAAAAAGAALGPGLGPGPVRSMADDWRSAKAIYDFHALDIDGNDLVDLHARYAERGLRILGFPCNQFGKQEPGDNAQIKAFAENYGVKFDMYSKIDVNGDDAHPLWKWMKEQPKGRGTLGNAIKWNFTKFLINREGQVVKRYSPMEDPYVIEKDLPAYL